MHIILRTGIIFTMVFTLSAGASDNADSWTPLTHRGWTNSYTYQNSSFQVTVAGDVGGRICWFGTPYINLMLTDTNLNGRTLAEGSSWMPWDGCQTDLIDDQDQRQFGVIWLGPYQTLTRNGLELTLRSKVHPELQVQVTKRYRIHPEKQALHYTVEARNRGTNSIGLCIWERALFATPGKAWLPITPEGLIQQNVPENSVMNYDGLISITPSGDGASVSSASHEGWTAFTHGEYSALLKTGHPQEAQYRNDETTIIYFADNRVELEPLSPVKHVAPGEAVIMETTWHLLRHASGDDDALGAITDLAR